MQLLSGNEAIALGAYHSGVRVATAYPGTPSTEILESVATFSDIYAEWSTNEKVAMEVALGAAYAGVRAMVSMKHVGLNVASDPFMAASTTGVSTGLVVVVADDPGMHSSQNEQDSRHYARLAKIPVLEPADSQEAYDFMAHAFTLSEEFDTPVMVRSTTRISHSKSVVRPNRDRLAADMPAHFQNCIAKYVMMPVFARQRHPAMEERLVKLADYAETFYLNQVFAGESRLGIVTGGVAYHYAREVFPKASVLKLGMSYPLPANLIRSFAAQVDRLVVIEELDPFLEDLIRSLGIRVEGKDFIPRVGELNPDIVARAGRGSGLFDNNHNDETTPLPPEPMPNLPPRAPLLCPGCPHTGVFYILSSLGQRSRLPGAKEKPPAKSKLVITGDIGCYTLGAYPPLSAMDTCACMGASIGKALGMEKAGLGRKVVAVIGDSTFLHSGITSLVDAVYNDGRLTVVILDNGTTAMTGHQHHPGTGVSAQGRDTNAVSLEGTVRGLGINDVTVVSAFDIKGIRTALKSALAADELSVVIVRGPCAVRIKRTTPRVIDPEKCNNCGTCRLLGCPAIRSEAGRLYIEPLLCVGESCGICEQVCPRGAIH